jgi:hypothetical protein
MMQKIIENYETLLKITDEKEFNREENRRICWFCQEAEEAQEKDFDEKHPCSYCRITKHFGVKCSVAFPSWFNFYHYNIGMPLKKRKTLLRAALKYELKQWGTK